MGTQIEAILRKNIEKVMKEKGTDDKDMKAVEKVYIDFFHDVFGKWAKANMEVEHAAQSYKNIYSNIEKETEKSKADVLKEIWAGMKEIGQEMPALDEDMLAELDKQSAAVDFISPWATADKLYKSVALDRFGSQYLVGIYETIEAAQEAFLQWKANYDESFATRDEEYKSKTKIAASEEKNDAAAKEKIRNTLKEARANMGYAA